MAITIGSEAGRGTYRSGEQLLRLRVLLQPPHQSITAGPSRKRGVDRKGVLFLPLSFTRVEEQACLDWISYPPLTRHFRKGCLYVCPGDNQ